MCRLLRIGQCRAVDVLNEVAWPQAECRKLFAITARVNSVALHLAGYIIGRRTNYIRKLGHVFCNDILNTLRVVGRTADCRRAAPCAHRSLWKFFRQFQDFQVAGPVKDDPIGIHSMQCRTRRNRVLDGIDFFLFAGISNNRDGGVFIS